jgi:hypothetical protein
LIVRAMQAEAMMRVQLRGGSERSLKIALAGLVAAASMTMLAGPIGAAPSPRKATAVKAHHRARAAALKGGTRRPDPYIERDASKMRFGSGEWWEQMRREGRLGGETP